MALQRVLVALGPYRDDVILIGGWVPYLYQRFGGFSHWEVDIARTRGRAYIFGLPPNVLTEKIA
ncbi:MAG: hypothetical protein M3P26_00600 [Gemmatimonadota bacterium]|nr:hypothetical protein [Gemmatimonadota bacterium]